MNWNLILAVLMVVMESSLMYVYLHRKTHISLMYL